MRLNEFTITQANNKLVNKEITSVELTEACLARIKEVDDKIKACLTVCEKEAVEMAKEADKKREKGENGELLGIPMLVKDNIMTAGIRTTAASKILENYIAPYNATVVKKLKQAGVVILGKTNLDEFGHGASTENSAFGPTHNPWDLERVPGGSSGGSAAAVAADMCMFALGTDTGGSIRHPAGYCGVIGLKPTYGRISRFGLIAMTSSTDVPGIITKTTEDAALILKAVAGVDKNDSTTVDYKVDDYANNLKSNIKGIKIGLPEEFFIKGMNKDVEKIVRQAIKEFEKFGAEIIEISLPHTKYAIAAYYIIIPSEISSNLARFDGIKYGFTSPQPSPSPKLSSGQAKGEGDNGAKNLMEVYLKSRGKGFGPEAKRRIMLGTYALSAGYYDAYYLQAQKVRTVITNELDKELSNVDVILTPTTPDIAFKIGQKGDPLAMYLEDIFMSSASLAGLPAMSVPCGFVDGLPVGMQLIGKRFDEATIFQVANNYQQATNWHDKKLIFNFSNKTSFSNK